MEIKLPEQVKYILSALEAQGYRADIVGGSVRDALIGREIGDYDITTSALPAQTKAVFSERRIIETGIKHGTVSLLIDGETYEITTYRTDGEYLDSRHPSEVSFVKNIDEDLSRRDFTVNAMAYSPMHGLTDLFGGREDIETRVIRAVGDPYKRFDEDALRILRALRFASVLGFKIDENTAAAAREKCEKLRYVSAERIFVELKKLFFGISAYEVVSKYGDILLTVLPGLNGITLPDKTSFDRAEGDVRLLSIYALSSSDPSASFKAAMTSLKTDRLYRDTGAAALKAFEDIEELDERSAALLIKDYGLSASTLGAKLGIMLKGLTEKSFDSLTRVKNGALPYKISDLKISGDEVMKEGFEGAEIGRALNLLLLAVIDGECENESASLKFYLKNKLK